MLCQPWRWLSSVNTCGHGIFLCSFICYLSNMVSIIQHMQSVTHSLGQCLKSYLLVNTSVPASNTIASAAATSDFSTSRLDGNVYISVIITFDEFFCQEWIVVACCSFHYRSVSFIYYQSVNLSLWLWLAAKTAISTAETETKQAQMRCVCLTLTQVFLYRAGALSVVRLTWSGHCRREVCMLCVFIWWSTKWLTLSRPVDIVWAMMIDDWRLKWKIIRTVPWCV